MSPMLITHGSSVANIQQRVVADPNNSSTTNLATPNYIFTGIKSSTLHVAAIQVSLYANQNCIIKIQQSPEGDNWDLIDTYYYTSLSNFGVTVQAVSSYCRVVVTTNNLTTTIFRLQTALCPVAEPLPRSLDVNQRLKVGNPMDYLGFRSYNTMMGEQRVSEPIRLIGTIFDGTTIDNNFWTAVATGTASGASIAQASAQIKLTSGTASGNTVTLNTVRRARYISGHAIRYRAAIQASAGKTANIRRWGIGWGSTAMPTVTDGAWFILDAAVFKLQVMKTGSPTTITAFNGNLGATYTPGTNVVTYEIYWTNAKIHFVIDGELLHVYSSLDVTWADTKSFHVFADNKNSDTLNPATSETLEVRTAAIHGFRPEKTAPQYKNITGVTAEQILKYGPGTLHRVIVGTPQNNKTVTICDNVTGTTNPISLITTASAAIGSVYEYDCPFFNGLNVKPSDNGLNLTVIYE